MVRKRKSSLAVEIMKSGGIVRFIDYGFGLKEDQLI